MRRRAFTLMEVMAAVAICSLALFAILQVVQGSAAASAGDIDRRVGMLIAEEEMLRLEFKEMGWDDPLDRLSGDVKPMSQMYKDYKVEAKSDDAELPFESDVNLRELMVTVTWGPEGGQTEYSLTNYLVIDSEAQ